MIEIEPQQRRALRAQAHHLHPVVTVGQAGLTPQVKHEIDLALRAHGLIKVRVFSDDRSDREAMLAQIADELDAAPIQHLGKLLILWRPQEDTVEEKKPAKPAKAAKRAKPVKQAKPAKPARKRAPPKPSQHPDARAFEPVARRARGGAAAQAGDGETSDRRARTSTRATSFAPRPPGTQRDRGATPGATPGQRATSAGPRGKSAPNPRRRRRAA